MFFWGKHLPSTSIYHLFWLVVSTLWKMGKSVGIIIPNIWENKIHVPNHQPVFMARKKHKNSRFSLPLSVTPTLRCCASRRNQRPSMGSTTWMWVLETIEKAKLKDFYRISMGFLWLYYGYTMVLDFYVLEGFLWIYSFWIYYRHQWVTIVIIYTYTEYHQFKKK